MNARSLKMISPTLTFIFCLLRVTLADSQERRNTISGDSPLFIDRGHYAGHKWLSSVVAGDYLYYAGGEIYYTDQNDSMQHVSCYSTYSIDVTSDWTNATVAVTQINTTIADGLNELALWNVKSESTYYAYNGVEPWWTTPANPPANRLLEFTPDGSGRGSYSEDTSFYTANSNFSNLVRVSNAVSACGPDTCYSIGGKQNSRTENGIVDPGVPTAGIVSYNFTSRIWRNDTLIGDVFTGSWMDGQLVHTDLAGQRGSLVAMGGTMSLLADVNTRAITYGVVYLYDIATKTWYQQQTTGDIPGIRRGACAVAVEGGNTVNKTLEVFLYGGFNDDDSGNNIQLADVWVLSLPAFQWHRAGLIPDIAHAFGSCAVAGKRQMVVVGGMDPDATNNTAIVVKDERPLGISVFDLSDMVWKDRFSANAAAYASPKVVTSWYADNGYMSQNISDDVRALFAQASTDTNPSNSSSPSSPSSSSNSGASGSTGGSHVGAIAGGVVGGVVLVVAIIVAIYMYRRRQRDRRQDLSEQMTQLYEEDKQQKHGYEADSQPRYEADGQQIREQKTRQPLELP